ncbi:MAG: (d)CMP kinase [Polyangiaceae bacterium]
MSARKRPVVAIDGPAGAGKSTVTRVVAERLGYLLVDTGAIYRTVALGAERAGISWEDEVRVAEYAQALSQREALRLERGEHGQQKVLLEGLDVSGAIRTLSIGQGASKVSAFGGVRQALLELQRRAGRDGGVVLEGRDIGTVVFPDAEAKFFLTASVSVRAKRRHEELSAKGEAPPLEQVMSEVVERDKRDSSRPVAPLKQAADAIVVDSSELGIEQVATLIVEHVRDVERRLGGTSA